MWLEQANTAINTGEVTIMSPLLLEECKAELDKNRVLTIQDIADLKNECATHINQNKNTIEKYVKWTINYGHNRIKQIIVWGNPEVLRIFFESLSERELNAYFSNYKYLKNYRLTSFFLEANPEMLKVAIEKIEGFKLINSAKKNPGSIEGKVFREWNPEILKLIIQILEARNIDIFNIFHSNNKRVLRYIISWDIEKLRKDMESAIEKWDTRYNSIDLSSYK